VDDVATASDAPLADRARRKWTFISMVAVLTPTSAKTEEPMALSIREA
jgi:hypothetical protein